MRIPGPRRGVITQIEGDERDPRLDQSPGQESLLTPEVLAVSVADLCRFPRQIEGLLGFRTGQHVHGGLGMTVHHVNRGGMIESGSQHVEVPEQRTAVHQPLVSQPAREPEEFALGLATGVDTDVRVDRQLRGAVGDEWVELLAQVTPSGDVVPRGLERDIGRQTRLVRPAPLRDHRPDGREILPGRIDPGGGIEVAGLEHLVRLVVAVLRVHGPDDGEPIQHRRHPGQMLAE